MLVLAVAVTPVPLQLPHPLSPPVLRSPPSSSSSSLQLHVELLADVCMLCTGTTEPVYVHRTIPHLHKFIKLEIERELGGWEGDQALYLE